MSELLQEQVKAVSLQYNALLAETEEIIHKLHNQLEFVAKALIPIENSWAGNWGYTDYSYYRVPGTDGVHMSEDRIYSKLKKETSVDLVAQREKIIPILKKYRNQKDNTVIELSVINDLEGYEKESELLDNIENFKWGMTPQEYIQNRKPQNIIIEDYSILSKGLSIPPHISVSAELVSQYTIIGSMINFQESQKRLLRQIEIKMKLKKHGTVETEDRVSKFLIPIIERFHHVTTQMKNRHDKRGTLEINDEYDVQDLLHSLMKIHFDDIRPEVAISLYAGRNTRVDFQLKKEQTVIEVKKTRAGLKDKEVGDQLILDVAHYGSNPECKKLICFVYDPDNLISNPRGLEDDINKLSTEQMIVEVYIRP